MAQAIARRDGTLVSGAIRALREDAHVAKSSGDSAATQFAPIVAMHSLHEPAKGRLAGLAGVDG